MTIADAGRRKWFSLPKSLLARTSKVGNPEAETPSASPNGNSARGLPVDFPVSRRWPAKFDDRPPERKPVILVAMGTSELSLLAAEWAMEMARKMDASLVLVHAVHLNLTPYGPANPAWLKAGLCQEAIARAESIMTRGQAAGVSVTCAVEEGEPATVIAKTAQRWQAQFIVLATSKSGFFKRLFGERIVEKVLHQAECPVIILESARSGRLL